MQTSASTFVFDEDACSARQRLAPSGEMQHAARQIVRAQQMRGARIVGAEALVGEHQQRVHAASSTLIERSGQAFDHARRPGDVDGQRPFHAVLEAHVRQPAHPVPFDTFLRWE